MITDNITIYIHTQEIISISKFETGNNNIKIIFSIKRYINRE